MTRTLALFALLATVGCSSATMLPRQNSREEIVAYVNRGADLVAAAGSAACRSFVRPEWKDGEWYLFVLDERGRTVCHAAQPSFDGTPATELVDPNGKPIGMLFVSASEQENGGWVEYVWARPGTSVPIAKSTFVRRVVGPDSKSYIVGSGGYELP